MRFHPADADDVFHQLLNPAGTLWNDRELSDGFFGDRLVERREGDVFHFVRRRGVPFGFVAEEAGLFVSPLPVLRERVGVRVLRG
jgi:hypothetical protein